MLLGRLPIRAQCTLQRLDSDEAAKPERSGDSFFCHAPEQRKLLHRELCVVQSELLLTRTYCVYDKDISCDFFV